MDAERWQAMSEALMGRIAGRFTRVEPRRRARSLVSSHDVRARALVVLAVGVAAILAVTSFQPTTLRPSNDTAEADIHRPEN
jgi:hypothetical protein